MKIMKKTFTSILLICCLMLSTTLVSVSAEPIQENCHTMTAQWFGNKNMRRSVGVVDGDIKSLLYGYFDLRESSYVEDVNSSDVSTYSSSSSSKIDISERLNRIEELQEKANIQITDAAVTTIFDSNDIVFLDDETVVVYVYEWTFFDYDDLNDDKVSCDVSGYGTYHKVTLKKTDSGYVMTSDEYDESDILGICTLTESTYDELASMDFEAETSSSGSGNEDGTMLLDVANDKFYADYDVNAVVTYADQYINKDAGSEKVNYEEFYNSAYANFNSVGGDCANYTSQCINAGGMPQVKGEAYGRDGWYYVTSSNRSGTWTKASYLREWMGANRGTLLRATDETVLVGSPVFYNDDHATICVGVNSAGTPIINSHNYDRYHVVWNYWEDGTTYTTVQLTKVNEEPEVDTSISIVDVKYPTTLEQGKGYGIGGTVISGVNITKVTVGVYDLEGNMIIENSGVPNTTIYNIKPLDAALKFSILPRGQHYYRVVAENEAGVKAVLINELFTVLSDGNPFLDVEPKAWYYKDVKAVYTKKIMNGYTEDTFAPEENLTRAQFATMIHRLEGSPKLTFKNTFSDVKPDMWYSNAVIWTNTNEIVYGYGGTNLFGVNDDILREQLVVMLYRYANYKGYDTDDYADISGYVDCADVSDYANVAMSWAVQYGIVTGKGDNNLAPLDTATRAECAAIFNRFMTMYSK